MISPKEIKSVENIGLLDGEPVSMLVTIGGLHVIAGKPKGKQKAEALSAASHGAIAKYNVIKQYGNRFQPALQKSEGQTEPVVHDRTALLSKENQQNGFKLYTISTPIQIESVIVRGNDEVVVQTALIKAETLEVQSAIRVSDIEAGRDLNQAGESILKAFAAEGQLIGKSHIAMESKKFALNKIVKG
jgi:hypothetical protein